MQNILKKSWNKATKKTFQCQGCTSSLRVPIKPGKKLLITCPKCLAQTMAHFSFPLFEIFKWNKRVGFFENLKNIHYTFNNFKFVTKIEIIALIITFAMIFDIIIFKMLKLVN